ncbi:hypothetical protein D3C83_320640 [compost metagenome]
MRTSDGTAEMSRIVIGLPLTGMRNRLDRISDISSRRLSIWPNTKPYRASFCSARMRALTVW